MKKILVLTPSYSGGSWVASEKIVLSLADKNLIKVIGLGNVFNKDKRIKYYSIPYPKYESWGGIHSKSPLLAFLWNIPLSLLFIFFLIFWRPKLIITNGFSSVLPFTPLVKFLRINTIILYHGVIIGFMSDRAKKIVKKLTKYIDLVIVNSLGSKNDIKSVINENKIIINEHFADDLFFKNKFKIKTTVLKVIYAGSLNKEKRYGPLIESIKKLDKNKFQFTFVGRGRDQAEIENLVKTHRNVRYLGYISQRKKMSRLYEESDVLWTYADETYLSLPATESLASGVPIIVPKYPGMFQKSKHKILIPKSLIPSKIGWIVDTDSQSAVDKLLNKLQSSGISKQMRTECREFAKEKYSSSNLDATIDRINHYL